MFGYLHFNNTGIFYFTLGNLRPKYRSKYASIQLLIACKREFITKYSLNAVLQPLVDDLKTLVGTVYLISVRSYSPMNVMYRKVVILLNLKGD